MSSDKRRAKRGTLAWMVRNGVTPNLLMLILLIGGVITCFHITQEVFPSFERDSISITVGYPGASPEEVESGVVLVIEEAVRGLEGVKEVQATASEGSARVRVELLDGVDVQAVYQDVRQAVDRITTLPDDVDLPQVSIDMRRREVLDVQLFGHVDEWTLRHTAEMVRDRLLQSPGITQVELEGARDFEIVVEPRQDMLRSHQLSRSELADRIRQAVVELPGGTVRTRGGDILLRVRDKRDWADDFAALPIINTAEGSVVRLGALAEIREGFEDTNVEGAYNGARSIGVAVYRVGDQTPIGVSDLVKQEMATIAPSLPPGIGWQIGRDRSDIYRQRLELLMRNAALGLMLVLLVLGLFLEIKLAFWVTMGIPISFLGGILLLPWMGVTINMISMFAFIVALGIVVDDAIVVGENIYEYRQNGMDRLTAAIRGAQDIALPVTFSVLTNIVAFLPLMYMPGVIGKIFRVIPLVVCTVFAISLFESLWILPAHLAHTGSEGRLALTRLLHQLQQGFSHGFTRMVELIYGPVLRFFVTNRIVTLCLAVGVLVLTVGYVQSGRIGRIMMPRVESDRAVATAVLPVGSSLQKLYQVRDRMLAGGDAAVAANGGEQLSMGSFALVEGNQVEVTYYLTDPKIRPISTTEMTRLWREQTGAIPGLVSLKYESDRGGPGGGAALTVELSHANIEVLDRAGAELARRLESFENIRDVDDGYAPGKRQLTFRLNDTGRRLGLTAVGLARQLRNAYQGAEAIKQQRGRNEVTVRVRRPSEERDDEAELLAMLIRTPAGGEVPLADVASVVPDRAYTNINRTDGRRMIEVTADVVPISQTEQVLTRVREEIMPQMVQDFPGLQWGFGGRQQDMREGMGALGVGLVFALMAIYALLAIPFRSYIQPLIILSAIPFGIVGAVWGHVMMGYSLSMMSYMGIIALCGVVVNDSLVLVEYANRIRVSENLCAFEAICRSAVRRFRPVLLTTLTTFGGLAPMIFETSRQARFLIPMAISLGFGILFATLVTLLVVPCLYVVIDQAVRLGQWCLSLLAGGHRAEQGTAGPV